jgi:hypothetical protein
MSLTPEEKLRVQANTLTTETNKNPEMEYNKIPALNTGLDPKFFFGSRTKIVNAINTAMDRAESARQYGADLYKKFNKIILDTSSSYGQNKFLEMIEKTEQETLVEAIIALSDRIDNGDITLTSEMITESLGYIPIKEAEYIVGIVLDDDENIETQD